MNINDVILLKHDIVKLIAGKLKILDIEFKSFNELQSELHKKDEEIYNLMITYFNVYDEWFESTQEKDYNKTKHGFAMIKREKIREELKNRLSKL